MQIIKNIFLYTLIFITLLSLSCSKKKEPQILFEGKVKSLIGQALIFKSKTSKWEVLNVSDAVEFGDSIKTTAESQVEIAFGGNSTAKIGENSKVAITLVKDSAGVNTVEVFTAFGSVLSNIEKLTGRYNQYQVRTPTATAAIRGTFFFVFFHLHKRITHVNVFRGRVRVRNPHVIIGPPLILLPGFFTVVHVGRVPIVPKKLNYGQMKKVMPLMPPGQYKKFNKKFKITKKAKPMSLKKIHKKAVKGKSAKAKMKKPGGPKKAPHKPNPVQMKKILKKAPVKIKGVVAPIKKVVPKKKKAPKGGKKK